MAGINVAKILQALIFVRVALETLPTTGKIGNNNKYSIYLTYSIFIQTSFQRSLPSLSALNY